jgi:hypothetical protein
VKEERIGIILPTFNVEKTITDCLENLIPLLCHSHTLLIIDNQSTDGTVALVERFLSQNQHLLNYVALCINRENLGYGASIKAGFEYHLTKEVGSMLVLHSDNQTDNFLLAKRLEDESIAFPALNQVILGSRFTLGSELKEYSSLRKVANIFFNWLTRVCVGSRLSDAGTAMTLTSSGALRKINFQALSDDWRFHPEFNILVSVNKEINLREIPMEWADSSARSSVPLVKYGFKLSALILTVGFHRLIRRPVHESVERKQSPVPQDLFIILESKDLLERYGS